MNTIVILGIYIDDFKYKKECLFMLEISLIFVMAMVLLSMSVILIVFFVKHLNLMHAFIGDILKNQALLHKDILELKVNLTTLEEIEKTKNIRDANKYTKPKSSSPIKTKDSIQDNSKINEEITDLKSSQITEEELSKLMEGKELVFRKQVNVTPGEMFLDTDIDI